jgi:hypothetical protein
MAPIDMKRVLTSHDGLIPALFTPSLYQNSFQTSYFDTLILLRVLLQGVTHICQDFRGFSETYQKRSFLGHGERQVRSIVRSR